MGTNYYVRTPPCPNACEHCDVSERIHLGKSSGGWQFSFRADSNWPRETAFTSWLTLAMSGPIEDEYGESRTIGGLLLNIHTLRDQRSHLQAHPDLGVYNRSDGKAWFVNEGFEFCTRGFS